MLKTNNPVRNFNQTSKAKLGHFFDVRGWINNAWTVRTVIPGPSARHRQRLGTH